MSINNLFPPDPNNDPDFPFNYDPNSGPGIDPFAQDSGEQAIYALIEQMGSVNNNIRSPEAYFSALIQLAGNGKSTDPNIVNFLNGLTGADGSSAGSFFSDMFMAQWVGQCGIMEGDPTKALSHVEDMINQIKKIPGADSNPILSPMLQELEKWSNPVDFNTFIARFQQNGTGDIGFTDPVTGTWYDCTTTQNTSMFNSFLSGQVGQWINGSPSIKDQLHDLRMTMVDSLANDPRVKQYGPGFLLFVMISMILINGNDSKQAGYANNMNDNSGFSKDLSQVTGNFNAANFTGPDAATHAQAWMSSLVDLQTKMDVNSNFGDTVATTASAFNGDENVMVNIGTATNPNNVSLISLYKSGDYTDLATGLATESGSPSTPSSGGTPNEAEDNHSTYAKALSSASSTKTTQMQALAQVENQDLTALTTACNQEKTMRQAACDAVAKS